MKKILLAAVVLVCSTQSFAQVDSIQMMIDSVEARLDYQHGEIKLNEIGVLNVPQGFGFLDSDQARFVLETLWGNPEDSTVMGLIVPDGRGVMANNSWAFIITFDEMGYVEDDDATDIDYDDLLEEMKTETVTESDTRVQLGYSSMELIGWASKPFYDSEKKVLHWAKEFKFGDSEANTLNYNVRILGRKGVLVMNAVSSMNELSEVQNNIAPVLSSFTYAEGSAYSDFNPEIDEVAAWTIGGLVAGKVLAKAGFFAILLKYLKFIILGIGALGTAAWKWFKRKTELPEVRNIEDTNKQS
jgi:uncharacterized membrane-anchored protein